jgi:hypothetical protein
MSPTAQRWCTGKVRRGASFVEYLVLVAVVALGGVVAFRAFASSIGQGNQQIGQRVATMTPGQGATGPGAINGTTPVNAPTAPGGPKCDSTGACTGTGAPQGNGNMPMGQPTAADLARFQQILARQQAGERLSAEDLAFYQRLGATSDKALLTAAVGASVTVQDSKGVFVKYQAEANTDQGVGTAVRGGVKVQQGPLAMETASEVSPDGKGRVYTSAELQLLRRGPAGLSVGTETDTNGNAKTTVKANVEATGPVPGVGQGSVELYAEVSLNKLTKEEYAALGARMAQRAAQMGAAREYNQALLRFNLERRAMKLPPVDYLPPEVVQRLGLLVPPAR